MNATLLGEFEPGSEEWLAVRANRVGGSEAAVCLGISPFESRFSLWHRKAGLADPQSETPILEWGKRLESAVLGRWFDDHPGYTDQGNGVWLSDDHPFMVASPDRLVANSDGELELVEIKTSPFGDEWGPSGSDRFPVYYWTQVLHYMIVLGISRAHLAVLISGWDYREYTIEINDQVRGEMQLIIAAEREFIDSLPGGPAERRPDIDEHSQTLQVVRELHPNIAPQEAVEVAAELAEEYVTACQQVKDAEAAKRKAAATVLDVMGDAQYATHNGNRIASRQAKAGGTPYLVATRTKKAA